MLKRGERVTLRPGRLKAPFSNGMDIDLERRTAESVATFAGIDTTTIAFNGRKGGASSD